MLRSWEEQGRAKLWTSGEISKTGFRHMDGDTMFFASAQGF